MRIVVIGGGPAGLLFSALSKRLRDEDEVEVFEQNSVASTYGFGVVLSAGTLSFIEANDEKLHGDIVASSEHLQTITIVHKGERVPISGQHFYGIERLRLLNLLRERASAAGVSLIDDCRITNLEGFAITDLLVGADGVNSIVRQAYENEFETHVTPCRNMMIWYGTECVSDGIELIFNMTEWGLFIGHSYPYRIDMNTFVIECSRDTWRAAGLAHMEESASIEFCNEIFRHALGGGSLISNRSTWLAPRIVKTSRWARRGVTLIGDAVKTMHPSIGSGTRAAMEDAVALAHACHCCGDDVEAALALYERERRPVAERLQASAIRSIGWYESVEDRLHLSPLEFSYDYMMRTGRVTPERLVQMDHSFARRWQQFSGQSGAHS